MEKTQLWGETMTTEHYHQVAVVRWANIYATRVPELYLLFAIPNAGKRGRKARGQMLDEGLKAGVPDLCLPVARGGYHGLFIEMKTAKGKVTHEQRAWLQRLDCVGYRAVICRGSDAAIRELSRYINGQIERGPA